MELISSMHIQFLIAWFAWVLTGYSIKGILELKRHGEGIFKQKKTDSGDS